MISYNLLGILFFFLSIIVQMVLKSKMTKFSHINLRSILTGAEVAKKMLNDNGILDVKIVSVEGFLNDHYNPLSKTVNLSQDVFYGSNVAAAAVAAHECGHAVQHARGYAPLKLRSAMVPMVTVSSRWLSWLIFGGILFMRTSLFPLKLGILLYVITTFFSFITLPVEVNASNRALDWMRTRNVAYGEENKQAQEALTWAAMTYVIAALGALAELLRLLSYINRRNND
ncbi:MAG: zinc metallopeptidase [Cytophagales bacterium]|jgi:Zn-dependent membrane protease YugP|nr:zinc metallopeptidase [Cytophagales bacterium]